MANETFAQYHTALTALDNSTADQSADYVPVYDASASTEKKLLLKHVGVGEHTVNLLAAGMVTRTTNGPSSGSSEKTTNKVMVVGYDFDAATEENLQIMFPLPKGYNSSGSIITKFYWTSAGTAGTGDVVWGIRSRYMRNDDATDAAVGTGVEVTDTFIADGDIHVTSETSAMTPAGTFASECILMVEVYRKAANGSDTYTQDARLLGVMISLPYSANTDD